MNTSPILTSRFVATVAGIIWCHIQPSLNFVAICAFALMLDCFSAWRCNRRIRRYYAEQIKKNPKLKIDGKLKSRKMAKMIQDFSVLILAVFLAGAIDSGLLAHLGGLHLANYLAAIYCVVQFTSVLENESTCNGAAWAKVLQKVVADKTERHLDISHEELQQMMKEEEEANTDNKDSCNS